MLCNVVKIWVILKLSISIPVERVLDCLRVKVNDTCKKIKNWKVKCEAIEVLTVFRDLKLRGVKISVYFDDLERIKLFH